MHRKYGDSIVLQDYYKKYGLQKVDEALKYLNYKAAPAPLPKGESDQYPTLFVFRHGQTTDNANMVFCGWRDSDLTPKGIEQAQVLAEKLKNKDIDMLFASDQIRAIHTMEWAIEKNIKAKNLEIIQDPRLRERSYGDLQGKSKFEMQLSDPKLLLSYRRTYSRVPPNGESIEQVVKRVKKFIDELVPMMKEKNINVAVSCHGNSVRGFRQIFENLTNEETAVIETPLGQDYAAYAIK